MSDDLKQWSKLLQAIAKGVVIPIVGRDLLRIEVDGREQLLYEYLAAQLAAQLEVECEPSASIDQVVAAYLNASRRNSRDDVNLKAFEILNQIGATEGHLPVPEPLRKLGAIQPLRLFLSTTVDSLLANALGSPADHVFAYSPNSPLVDIPRDYARSPYRVVFHLFGRISGIPDSALIDEETLEFIWKLHEESMSVRLANLFDELRTRRLLLIGNAHPDWLARFFVRLARRDASIVATKRANLSPTEQSLRRSTRTTFWKISARRPSRLAWPIPSSSWTSSQRNGTPSQTSPRLPDRELLQSLLPPSLPRFWLATPARTARLSSGCRPASVSWAWMSGLTKGASSPAIPGGTVIEQNIATCDVFVAVISANTNRREEGIFIREMESGAGPAPGHGQSHRPDADERYFLRDRLLFVRIAVIVLQTGAPSAGPYAQVSLRRRRKPGDLTMDI